MARPNLPAPISPLRSRSTWSRILDAGRVLMRAALASIGAVQSAPPPPGISSGRVAAPRQAEEDLAALATSPTVFAAVNRRAQTLTMYPIRCLLGYSIGGQRPVPLDPERVAWVGALLRLLQTPDPADMESLFPAETGEGLLSQVVADLLLTGNAFVSVQVDKANNITGLYRLHPQGMTLERKGGEDWWVFRPANGTDIRRYPRRSVAHLRLLSWQRGGAGELGTGAGSALRPLVQAERAALEQSANVVDQGGADIVISGKDATSAAFLQNPVNREQVAKDAVKALKGGTDGTRRVMVVGGNYEIKDSGFSPADMRAPELLQAAARAELMAVGVVPVAVGADAGTYATAVQQYRVQAEQDEGLASVIEAALLRPLARHFARQAGGRWAVKADQVTCRIDLSSHPGYAYLRTEQIGRMTSLVALGWSAAQAAEIEGLDVPAPAGLPMPPAAPGTPPPSNGPSAPVGDGGQSGASSPPPPRALTLAEMFGRAIDPDQPRLDDSEFDRPPYGEVAALKAEWPEIWNSGGEDRGDEAFEYWTKYVEGDRGEGVLAWVVEREAWGARHRADFRLPGVVAQWKWGVVGDRGLDHQREVIAMEKARLEGERANEPQRRVAEGEAARADAWAQAEQRREPSDRGLEQASQDQLDAELQAYLALLMPALEEAQRRGRPMGRAYAPIDLAALLGPLAEWAARWTLGLSPEWLSSWTRAAAAALAGIPRAGQVPVPEPVASDLRDLEDSAAQIADYSRQRVLQVVQDGMDGGLSPGEIQAALMEDQGFQADRALRIARTETVRSESVGTTARYRSAEAVGLTIEQEWLTSRDGSVRESHRALDGQRVPVDGTWRFPGGPATRGPGLSGDPAEDINCRCAILPRVSDRG